jgi:hypothetical protein
MDIQKFVTQLSYMTAFLLCLLFDPEEGGEMLLRNVGSLSTDCMALCTRSYHCENLISHNFYTHCPFSLSLTVFAILNGRLCGPNCHIQQSPVASRTQSHLDRKTRQPLLSTDCIKIRFVLLPQCNTLVKCDFKQVLENLYEYN